jgi:hypothetical protein
VKIFDKLSADTTARVMVTTRTRTGAVTVAEFNPARQSTPLDALLASAGIAAPPAGQKLDLDRLDAKLAGESIGRRLEIKSALRQAGMLD